MDSDSLPTRVFYPRQIDKSRVFELFSLALFCVVLEIF